jgi:hypothetical protein
MPVVIVSGNTPRERSLMLRQARTAIKAATLSQNKTKKISRLS